MIDPEKIRNISEQQIIERSYIQLGRYKMTNIEKIRHMSEQQIIDLLMAAMRYGLSYVDICSCDCDTCMIHELCTNPKEDVRSMGESDWKRWLDEEVKEDDEP